MNKKKIILLTLLIVISVVYYFSYNNFFKPKNMGTIYDEYLSKSDLEKDSTEVIVMQIVNIDSNSITIDYEPLCTLRKFDIVLENVDYYFINSKNKKVLVKMQKDDYNNVISYFKIDKNVIFKLKEEDKNNKYKFNIDLLATHHESHKNKTWRFFRKNRLSIWMKQS